MPTYYSPLFENNFPLNTGDYLMNKPMRVIFKRSRKQAALMKALNGAAAGGTAAISRKRVVASTTEQGGVRPMETFYDVNRATTAADETAIDTVLTPTSRIATPTNKAGTFPA